MSNSIGNGNSPPSGAALSDQTSAIDPAVRQKAPHKDTELASTVSTIKNTASSASTLNSLPAVGLTDINAFETQVEQLLVESFNDPSTFIHTLTAAIGEL